MPFYEDLLLKKQRELDLYQEDVLSLWDIVQGGPQQVRPKEPKLPRPLPEPLPPPLPFGEYATAFERFITGVGKPRKLTQEEFTQVTAQPGSIFRRLVRTTVPKPMAALALAAEHFFVPFAEAFGSVIWSGFAPPEEAITAVDVLLKARTPSEARDILRAMHQRRPLYQQLVSELVFDPTLIAGKYAMPERLLAQAIARGTAKVAAKAPGVVIAGKRVPFFPAVHATERARKNALDMLAHLAEAPDPRGVKPQSVEEFITRLKRFTQGDMGLADELGPSVYTGITSKEVQTYFREALTPHKTWPFLDPEVFLTGHAGDDIFKAAREVADITALRWRAKIGEDITTTGFLAWIDSITRRGRAWFSVPWLFLNPGYFIQNPASALFAAANRLGLAMYSWRTTHDVFAAARAIHAPQDVLKQISKLMIDPSDAVAALRRQGFTPPPHLGLEALKTGADVGLWEAGVRGLAPAKTKLGRAVQAAQRFSLAQDVLVRTLEYTALATKHGRANWKKLARVAIQDSGLAADVESWLPHVAGVDELRRLIGPDPSLGVVSRIIHEMPTVVPPTAPVAAAAAKAAAKAAPKKAPPKAPPTPAAPPTPTPKAPTAAAPLTTDEVKTFSDKAWQRVAKEARGVPTGPEAEELVDKARRFFEAGGQTKGGRIVGKLAEEGEWETIRTAAAAYDEAMAAGRIAPAPTVAAAPPTAPAAPPKAPKAPKAKAPPEAPKAKAPPEAPPTPEAPTPRPRRRKVPVTAGDYFDLSGLPEEIQREFGPRLATITTIDGVRAFATELRARIRKSFDELMGEAKLMEGPVEHTVATLTENVDEVRQAAAKSRSAGKADVSQALEELAAQDEALRQEIEELARRYADAAERGQPKFEAHRARIAAGELTNLKDYLEAEARLIAKAGGRRVAPAIAAITELQTKVWIRARIATEELRARLWPQRRAALDRDDFTGYLTVSNQYTKQARAIWDAQLRQQTALIGRKIKLLDAIGVGVKDEVLHAPSKLSREALEEVFARAGIPWADPMQGMGPVRILGQYRDDLLTKVDDGARNAEGAWAARRPPTELTEQQVARVWAAWNESRRLASDEALMWTLRDQFDYRGGKNLADWAMQLFAPFPFWPTRWLMRWSSRLATHPDELYRVARLAKRWYDDTKDEPPSSWFTIRLYTMEDGTQLRFRPWALIFPFGFPIVELVREGTNPQEHTTTVELLRAVQNMLGLRPYPWIELVMGMAQIGTEESGLGFTRTPEQLLKGVIPQQLPARVTLLAADRTGFFAGRQEQPLSQAASLFLGPTPLEKNKAIFIIREDVKQGRLSPAEGDMIARSVFQGRGHLAGREEGITIEEQFRLDKLADYYLSKALGGVDLIRTWAKFLGAMSLSKVTPAQQDAAKWFEAYRAAPNDLERARLRQQRPDIFVGQNYLPPRRLPTSGPLAEQWRQTADYYFWVEQEREATKKRQLTIDQSLQGESWRLAFTNNQAQYRQRTQAWKADHPLAITDKEESAAFQARLGRDTVPPATEDLAYDEYLDILHSPEWRDPRTNILYHLINPDTREPNFVTKDKALAAWERYWGGGVLSYVKERLSFYSTDVTRAFYEDEEALRPYFEIWKDVLSGEQRTVWERYLTLAADPSAQTRYKNANYHLWSKANTTIVRARQKMRRSTPEIEARLQRWGWVTAEPRPAPQLQWPTPIRIPAFEPLRPRMPTIPSPGV